MCPHQFCACRLLQLVQTQQRPGCAVALATVCNRCTKCAPALSVSRAWRGGGGGESNSDGRAQQRRRGALAGLIPFSSRQQHHHYHSKTSTWRSANEESKMYSGESSRVVSAYRR